MIKTVVFGFLGTTLDAGFGRKRWERWRPTVALCQQEDLLVDRLELWYDRKAEDLLRQVTEDIRQVSPETQVVATELRFDDAWGFEEVFAKLLDFANAYDFDPDNERYLLHITTGTHVAQICQFLLAEAHYFPAALIQTFPLRKRGMDNVGDHAIIDLDLSRYDQIASRFLARLDDDISFLKSGIETRDAAFNRLIAQIEKIAVHSREPILLTGPTGAGKSQLARRIFELKKERQRFKGRFVEVNCATLRGDAAMSMLFGHRKGAFTGALEARDGLLRAANEGVLFLDEVAELGLDEQALLLRAIEDKRFLPVGADEEKTSDFQLVCGTNRDMMQRVAEGNFRDDLYARLNLWSFQLPGLRDRREDIQPNLDYELDRYARTHGNRVTMNKEARQRFLAFASADDALWTGNFRDLGGAVTRMATLAAGGRITRAIVDDEITRLRTLWTGARDPHHDSLAARLLGQEPADALDLFDRLQLDSVLTLCREHPTLSAAGRALFAASRTKKQNPNDADRLRKYLARFGLRWEEVRREP